VTDLPAETNPDVVVVGSGFAGLAAAIAAHDAGASTVVLEKMRHPGGISVCSAGGVRVAEDAEAAFRYLQECNAGTTPDPVLRRLADGMTGITGWVEDLARVAGATLKYTKTRGNYPLPGFETFGFVSVASIDGYDQGESFPQVRGMRGGARLYRVLQKAVEARGIPVLLETPARRLLAGPDGTIRGVRVERDGAPAEIAARRGVVLACGGFEADSAMQAQYWQERPVLPAAFAGNTGDGIRMAQERGAALWHMWHYHGTYGLRHPDPAYPFAIRLQRLPDWIPGEAMPEADLFSGGGPAGPQMAWIALDRDGRRFMNEYPPYLQDTGHRPMATYDPAALCFPRLPAWLLMDEDGRRLYPLGMPAWNAEDVGYDWSEDNLAEVEAGLLGRADSLEEAAARMEMAPALLAETVSRWNDFVRVGGDADFGRPAASLRPVAEPPFYFARLWPMVANTQGGPVHDACQRVVNPFDEPIPRLYACGELGSAFGFLYLSGGNISECLIGGRIAGREAAGLPALDLAAV